MSANHYVEPVKKSKTPIFVVVVILLVLVVVTAGVFVLFQMNAKTPSETKPTTTAVEKTAKQPLYVLVVGSDSRKGTVEEGSPDYIDDSNGSGRSDTIMLVRIDPITYTISLVSVPRDTEATVNGSTTKINESFHQYGIEGLKIATEELTGIKVKYSMVINFKNFEDLYSSLAVTANVPIDMNLVDIISGNKISLTAGNQQLTGPEALVLARVRKAYIPEYMDPSRQIQDRQLVQCGIKKVAADPSTVDANITLLRSLITTDWPEDSMKSIMEDFAQNAAKISFQSGTGPYLGDIAESGLWLVPRDTATWQELMKVVDAGGDPTTVIPLPEVAAGE